MTKMTKNGFGNAKLAKNGPKDNGKDFYLWAGNQPAAPRQTKNIKIRVKHLFLDRDEDKP